MQLEKELRFFECHTPEWKALLQASSPQSRTHAPHTDLELDWTWYHLSLSRIMQAAPQAKDVALALLESWLREVDGKVALRPSFLTSLPDERTHGGAAPLGRSLISYQLTVLPKRTDRRTDQLADARPTCTLRGRTRASTIMMRRSESQSKRRYSPRA